MINKTAAIIAAAGMGHRLGANLPKALVKLLDKTLVEHAVANLSPVCELIIVTAPSGYEAEYSKILGDQVEVITGGVLRSDSIRLAISKVPAKYEYVLVHDAARALASTTLASSVLSQLIQGEQAVVPALNVIDTIKEVDAKGYVRNTLDRSALKSIQTPQGFTRSVLERAHMASEDATDDAALVEALGIAVKVITGEFTLDKNRKLSLAGLIWEDEIGLDGHSDGDVASHAICDALLSAADLGDLGSNFGVAEAKYEGATGAQMLSESLAKVKNAGFKIENVSVQIVGNRPKIAPRRAEAISALSKALSGAKVSVSATSTDGLGFTGEGKGLSAIATALLVSA